MSHDGELPDPARVVLRRRIEWMDTDAAGIYHWTTVFRLAEAAEAALHTALGIADFTFGATPRVAVAGELRPLAALQRPGRRGTRASRRSAGRRSSTASPSRATGHGRGGHGQDVPHRPRDGPRRPLAGRHPRGVRRRRAAAGPGLSDRAGRSGLTRAGDRRAARAGPACGGAVRARAAGAGGRGAAPAGSAASPRRPGETSTASPWWATSIASPASRA